MKLGQTLCGLIVMMLAWCGSAAAAPGETGTILVYGDSNVWGWMPGTMAERYPASTRWSGRLADMPNLGRVVENGLNGRTTDLNQPPKSDNSLQNGLAGLPSALSVNAPLDVVIIALGVNDFQAANGRDAEATAAALGRLIAAVRNEEWRSFPLGTGEAPQVLVLAPSGFDAAKGGPFAEMYAGAPDKLKRLPALLKAEADRAGAEFLDLSAVVPVAHGADGLHYTPEDHERVAKAVAQKLRTMRR